ncbi:MAG: sigma-54 dependent transcriptional regulator [Syntrophaceticus sp.]|nr:sigma-54 dependent transcriptional regulator [Syntrophaceticus sp.]MDD4782528.1 sigma-54 dependent transcriptional regulator [Syntrophaceticus sp.]
MARILVVDDEVEMCNFFKFFLDGREHDLEVAENGAQAREALRHYFHLVLLDLKLPDTDGITLLKEIKTRYPTTEVVMMTGYSTVKTAVEAIQLGAYDYMEKPFENLDGLEMVMGRALSRALARREVRDDEELTRRKQKLKSVGFVAGKSEKMQRLLTIAEKLAVKNITMLIRGETGTGKEVLARYIHAVSSRYDKDFLAINCGAFTESLLESELFGHEKGSFTGAVAQHKGIFEQANHGTLFLDEIGESSPAIQVKLLRVLETGEVFRVGGEKPIRVDTRVIAATNAPLEDLVAEKKFREDLFYRLDVVTLVLPPLRERREDISLLAEHFLKRHYSKERPLRLSENAALALSRYNWPGNIRELANVIAQAAAICEGTTIMMEHLPDKVTENKENKIKQEPMQNVPTQQTPPNPIPQPTSEQDWLDEVTANLDAYIEQIDVKNGFDLPAFLDSLKDVSNEAAKKIIAKSLDASGDRYPKAARWLKTTPRVLRYLYKEKR